MGGIAYSTLALLGKTSWKITEEFSYMDWREIIFKHGWPHKHRKNGQELLVWKESR
jgi:hypothetical protein